MIRELVSFGTGVALKRAGGSAAPVSTGPAVLREITLEGDAIDAYIQKAEYRPNGSAGEFVCEAHVPAFPNILWKLGSETMTFPQNVRNQIEEAQAIIDNDPWGPSELLTVYCFDFRIVDGVCYVDKLVLNKQLVKGAPRV